MTRSLVLGLAALILTGRPGASQDTMAGFLVEEYSCIMCHTDMRLGFLEGVHSRRGILCTDCHGGDPTQFETDQAHVDGFTGSLDKVEALALCLSCHGDLPQMRQYALEPVTEEMFLVSRHGQGLLVEGDTLAPSCGDCHGSHAILPRTDPRSPVNPARIAETCSRCHSNPDRVPPGYPTDQFEEWSESAHGEALMARHNEQSAECASCHGSHSALPPGVREIPNVCGKCHQLVRETYFQGPHGRLDSGPEGGVPCTACHENHKTTMSPLSQIGSLCMGCHEADSPEGVSGLELQEQILTAEAAGDRAREAVRLLTEAGEHIADEEVRLFSVETNLKELLVQAHTLDPMVGAAGTVGFLEYSAQPGFCNNCHNMEPYYESWLNSSHNMVRCIECHYAPGIKAEAMGKVQAANQVVKYLTRTYSEKPWAEIEDAASTREGCHLEQRLGVVSYLGVRFDHAQHLGELRRGKDLRCTSCHSQIVQGQHLTVTSTTCNLCHFKDRPTGQPLGGCLGCHPSPPNLEYEGVPINHEQIVRDLVSCSKCHSDVVVGDGAAEEQRCWTCHNIPERMEEFDNPTLIHEVHIAEHNVECQLCHTEIQHKVVALEETLELECSNCHQGAHVSQQALVTGSGGHGVGDNPSRMFLARVTCESCHALSTELPGHEGVSMAGEATCMSCHGIEFAGILPGWVEEMQTRVDAVSGAVAQVRRALGSQPAEPADSLIRMAEENLELVRVGKGAHNIPYADELLRAAVRMAREAAEAGGANPGLASVNLGQPMEAGSCTSCHFGVDGGGVVTWQGRTFPHRRHTVNAGFDCQACHTPVSEHGGLTLASTATCDNCHHISDSPRACGFCHDAPAGDTIAFDGRKFIHDPHLEMGFGCNTCHQAPSMAVQEATCDGCHSLHHTPTANCLLCHDGAPQETVTTAIGSFPHGPHVEMGLTCATCHVEAGGGADMEVCAGCHSLHHQPSTDCRMCHTGDPKANHRADMAHVTACTVCHSGADQAGLTKWSPSICLVCHQDREEHSGGMECTLCHEIPPLPGGGGGGREGVEGGVIRAASLTRNSPYFHGKGG